MAQRDGVADGWILFEAWCRRNGGTPIRGRDSGSHICFVGPLPDDTIEPGDPGTVDAGSPGGGKFDQLELDKLDLKLREAQLRRDEAEHDFQRTSELIRSLTERRAKKS